MGKISLMIDDLVIDLTDDDYSEDFNNIDSTKKSEAGTNLRAVTRTNIRSLKVSYEGTEAEAIKLRASNARSSLTARLYDETEKALISWRCYMTGFSSSLIADATTNRFYKLSFSLEDLEA